jgi:hypothetical protein
MPLDPCCRRPLQPGQDRQGVRRRPVRLINTLRVPPEDFYRLIFELPKNRLLHMPSFVCMF